MVIYKHILSIIILLCVIYPCMAVIEPGTEDNAKMINSDESKFDKIVITLPPGLGQSDVVVSRSSTGKDETLPDDMQLMGVKNVNTTPVSNNDINNSKELPDDMKEILGNTQSPSSPQNGVNSNINSTSSNNKVVATDINTTSSENSSSGIKLICFIIAVVVLCILFIIYYRKNTVLTDKI